MKKMNRRGFMKMLAGVTAGLCATGKAEEPKYEVSCDLGSKEGRIIAGIESTPCFYGKYIRAHGAEAISKGQVVAYTGGYDDKRGTPWVKPIKHEDFYKA